MESFWESNQEKDEMNRRRQWIDDESVILYTAILLRLEEIKTSFVVPETRQKESTKQPVDRELFVRRLRGIKYIMIGGL